MVKIDGIIKEALGSDKGAFVKFLKENTHSGKVEPLVEVYNPVSICCKGDNENEKFHWVMSTNDLDRDFEKIDQKGWQLENYKVNPIVLWSHDRKIPAIGYAENVKADGALEGDIIFNGKDIDIFGWSIGQRVKAGALRSGSVSFSVIEVEFIDHRANPNEKTDLIYRQQELLEFSICNVPANPFAINTDKKTAKESEPEKTYHIYDYLTKRRTANEQAD